jgi:hypothetical protein
MKLLTSKIFWGIVLVVGGLLLLLDTFGVFEGGALFWTIIAGFAGILFISFFITNRDHWWALIPGVIFLSTAVAIGLNEYLPGFNEKDLTGAVIMGGIAVSFLSVYLAERSNWWAIIPAGILTTIIVVAFLDIRASEVATGGIFFLGLGLTFMIVAVLPTSQGRMKWAWIPAGILGIFGLLLLMTAEYLINYIWPSALILTGLFFIVRALFRKN